MLHTDASRKVVGQVDVEYEMIATPEKILRFLGRGVVVFRIIVIGPVVSIPDGIPGSFQEMKRVSSAIVITTRVALVSRYSVFLADSPIRWQAQEAIPLR